MEGRCTCGAIRYRLASPPLFTHCCHCRWCQRQTGSACVVNAMIETDRIQLLVGQPEMVSIPSPSGMGQTVVRCPTCKIALWSSYTIAGDKTASCARAPWTIRTRFLLSSIFLPNTNNRGWSCPPTHLPSPNSTAPQTTGRRRV